MLHLKVIATNDVTDLDYLKRRIEALGYDVQSFGKELYVRQGRYQTPSDGFRLAELLKNNSPLLVKYEVADILKAEWAEEDSQIKHNN